MDDNARVGELRGGRPDQPPDEPDQPAGDRVRSPEPPTNSNKDPRAIQEAWRQAEHPAFADPQVAVRYVTDQRPDTGPTSLGPYRTSKDRPEREPAPDGPTHRAPDIEPPSGKDLVEDDAPTRGGELRKQLFDEENLGNVDDVLDHVGEAIDDIWIDQPDRSPTTHTQARQPDAVLHAPDHALESQDALTAMFVTGILLGESVRVVYRKASELKERRQHARHG